MAASGVLPALVDFASCQKDQEKIIPQVADYIQSVLWYFGDAAVAPAQSLTTCIIRGLSGPWGVVLSTVELLHELLLRLKPKEQPGREESLEVMLHGKL